MNVRRAVAARLTALLADEQTIETRPIDEIAHDLQLLGIDAARSTERVRRLASEAGSPAHVLLARIADAEASEQEIANLETTAIDEVHARLQEGATVTRRPHVGSTRNPTRATSRIPPTVSPEGAKRRRAGDWLSPVVVVGLLRVVEPAIVLFAAILAYLTRFHSLEDFGTLELYGGVLGALLATNIFQSAGVYDFNRLTNLFGQSGRLLVALAAVMLGLLALGFMTKVPLGATSRLWVGLWFVYGFFGIFTLRLLLKQQIQRWQAQGRLTRRVAIIGTVERIRPLIDHLRQRDAEQVVAVFDDGRGGASDRAGDLSVSGGIDGLITFARRDPIDLVIIALPWSETLLLREWTSKLRTLPIDVCFCPHDGSLLAGQIAEVAGLPTLKVFEKPLSGWSYIVKAMEDRVLAAAILVLISPLLALMALLIKLDSRGPILSKEQRYGLSNEVIEVFKFRTSKAGSNERESQLAGNSPRLTRVGRFLRRTSLDELPQFINVLNGTMSIVGPRPQAITHDERYARLIEAYLARRQVKPGITGWAQVNGLRGETDTLEQMEQRVHYDLYYIQNWSLLFDLRIILRSAFVALRDSYAS